MKCKNCGHGLKRHRRGAPGATINGCLVKAGRKWGCECLHGEPSDDAVERWAEAVASRISAEIRKRFGDCDHIGNVYSTLMRKVREL